MAITSLRCVLSTNRSVPPPRPAVSGAHWCVAGSGSRTGRGGVSRTPHACRPGRTCGRRAARPLSLRPVSCRSSRRAACPPSAPRRCGTRAARGPRTGVEHRHPDQEVARPGPARGDDAGVLAVGLDGRVAAGNAPARSPPRCARTRIRPADGIRSAALARACAALTNAAGSPPGTVRRRPRSPARTRPRIRSIRNVRQSSRSRSKATRYQR